MPIIESGLTPEGIAFWKAGENGSPVLLIMGFGMLGLAWDRQFIALSKQHQVVCYDHIGLGKSHPIQDQPINMESMADHALSLLDFMGWESAHIIAVSMGGMIAQHLALKAKNRVKTLTLIATSAGGLLALTPNLKGLMGFLKVNLAKTAEQRFKALRPLLYPDDYTPAFDAIDYQKMIKLFAYDVPRKTRFSHIKAILKHQTGHRLHQLSDMKVTIIRPGKDILIRPNQNDNLHKKIPNSRLINFKNAGHGVMNQCAEELNQELFNLLAEFDKSISIKHHLKVL